MKFILIWENYSNIISPYYFNDIGWQAFPWTWDKPNADKLSKSEVDKIMYGASRTTFDFYSVEKVEE